MNITLIYSSNEHAESDSVFALMHDFHEAKKVVDVLNLKAQELAEAEHGADWEEYVRFYYAKECPVLTREDILSAIE